MKIDSPYNQYIQNGHLKPLKGHVALAFEGPVLYEVIRVLDGTPVFYEEHLHRLRDSATLMGIDLEALTDAIRSDAHRLIEAVALKNDNIKLLIGNDTSGLTWLWYGIKGFYPPESWYSEGIQATLLKETRKNPNAKVVHSKLAETVDKMRQEGKYFEGILVNELDEVLEGSRSNLFFIKGDTLITAPSHQVLKGITRMKILEMIENHQLKLEERIIHSSELAEFDGCFISGTSIDLLPIRAIDAHEYHTVSLPIMSHMLIWYREVMQASVKAFQL